MTLLYNGIQYEIEDEGEVEQVHIVSEGGEETMANVVATSDFRESAWELQNVQLFLDECIRRKIELRDPKVRRRQIFADIRERLREKGYNFRIESLDRKLRNMKIHYLVSRENNNKSFKRIHWPYYEKMKIIYPEAYCSTSSRKRSASNPIPFESNSSPPASPSISHSPPPSSSPVPSLPAIKPSDPPKRSRRDHLSGDEDEPKKNSYLDHPNKMESLRRQILSFEERRTIAAEKILNELRESNRLKRELLELNIKMFRVERELDEE